MFGKNGLCTMMHLSRGLLLLLIVCWSSLTFAQKETVTGTAKLANISFTTLSGATVRPFQGDNRIATVFVFIVRDCPIASAFAPEISRLAAEYTKKRIAFYLVYADVGASPTELRQHYKDFGYVCPAIYDTDRRLIKRLKPQRTPETVVLGRTGETLYQGRIDNRYIDFGKPRHQPTVPDLRRVLDACVSGDPPAPTTTPVIGCPIPE